LTIVIADELPVVRAGLKVIVESNHTGEVVGEAGDGLEALCLVEKSRPAMLITNLRLTRLSGLELVRQVQRVYLETKVIVASQSINSADLTSIFHHGAHGFMNLNSSAADIQKAIYEVNAGKRHLAPMGVEAILTSISNGGSAMAVDDAYDKLTAREREILQLAVEGHDRKAVASRLFISQRTVETHRAHIMQKLQLHSQTDLVRFAIRKGIIPA
jgi:two-component system, NarL family, response regulator NreC